MEESFLDEDYKIPTERTAQQSLGALVPGRIRLK